MSRLVKLFVRPKLQARYVPFLMLMAALASRFTIEVFDSRRFDLFTANGAFSKTFAPMMDIDKHEWHWGVALFIVLALMARLMCDPDARWRIVGLAIGTVCWVFFAALVFQGSPPALTWIFSATLALAHLIAIYDEEPWILTEHNGDRP